MMEGERTEHDIIPFFSERQNVAFEEFDLGIIAAQASSDFQSGWLAIDRVHGYLRAGASGKINYQPWNIAGTSRQIQNSHSTPRLDPAPQEMLDQPVAAEIAVELADVSQVALQFRSDRLRAIHQFRFRRVEVSLHRTTDHRSTKKNNLEAMNPGINLVKKMASEFRFFLASWFPD